MIDISAIGKHYYSYKSPKLKDITSTTKINSFFPMLYNRTRCHCINIVVAMLLQLKEISRSSFYWIKTIHNRSERKKQEILATEKEQSGIALISSVRALEI